MAAVAVLWYSPRLVPPSGTLIVLGAGRTTASAPFATVSLHRAGGSWLDVGPTSGTVPAAPEVRQLFVTPLQVGDYDAVRLLATIQRASVKVSAGLVEPLLLGFDSSGRLATGGIYAGNDEVNLGLGELSGKFVAMPAFNLVDQRGQPIDNATLAGRNVVIAAFHTTCHETCPLYTALFLQLAKHLPADAMLLEVTTDTADMPPVLQSYATEVGATWTFATGRADQLSAFWSPFDVELSSADLHTSTLVLVDRHGFVRLVYRGAPKVGSDIPTGLVAQLSSQGLYELGSGGDGWAAPDVLQALSTIAGAEKTLQAGGGTAEAFRLLATNGREVSLADYSGQPLVINFWASYCPPCKAEMPLLDRSVDGHSGARLVLVDEGETGESTQAFLDKIGIHRTALLDSDLSVGHSYGIFVLPMTIFVRADGTIDRRQVGQVDAGVLQTELSNLTTP